MLENDSEWFNRARLARVKATRRMEQQIKRIMKVVLYGLKSGDYSASEVLHAEALLTRTIKELYTIEADFDPEQYYKELERELLTNQKEHEEPKRATERSPEQVQKG